MYTKEMKGEAAIMRGGSPPLREGGWTIAASRFGGNPLRRTARGQSLTLVVSNPFCPPHPISLA